VFETLKAKADDQQILKGQQTVRKLIFGYLAGLCSETIIYPLDTVRRRQQALGEASPLSKTNVFAALRILMRTEGLFGSFKGRLALYFSSIPTLQTIYYYDYSDVH